MPRIPIILSTLLVSCWGSRAAFAHEGFMPHDYSLLLSTIACLIALTLVVFGIKSIPRVIAKAICAIKLRQKSLLPAA